MNRSVSPILLLLLGAYALLAQVVLFRELFVLFSGNELYIGMVFSSWLLWVSFGSAFFGRRCAPAGRWPIESGLLCASMLLVFTVAALRMIASGVIAVPGEILTPGKALLLSAASVAPCAIFSGYLFGCASRLLMDERRHAFQAGGAVYAWEAWGSGIAGLILGLVLFDRLGTFVSALLTASIAAAALLWRILGSAPGRFLRAALSILPLLLLVFLHPSIERLDLAMESRRLPGYSIVAFADSPYGRIDAVRREDQSMLFINGVPAATSPDPAVAEERVHIALSSHTDPRSVLLLGGSAGDCGAELAKYRLERITAVELDARAWALAETLGIGDKTEFDLHINDARAYVRSDSALYDVVILAMGEPISLQGNRYFTREFFSAIRSRLAPGGIVSITLPGSENLMLGTQEQVYACVYKTLAAVFPTVAFLPGETVHFIAGEKVPVASLPRLIPERMREREISVSFLQPTTLAFRFSETRMVEAEAVMHPSFPVVCNDDFGFSCYVYTVIDWYSKLGYPSARKVIPLIGRRTELFILFLLFLGALYGGTVLACARRPDRRIAVPSMLVAGFSGMAGGIALLVAFQIVCGVLYQWVAVLTGVFMIGAGTGSFAMNRHPSGLAFIHSSLLVLFLLFSAVLSIHQRHPLSFGSAKLLFLFMETALGLATGAAYVCACREMGNGTRVAPVLYAVDLMGGFIGAALFASVMLPLLGLPFATVLLAGINGIALAVAGFARR